MITNERIAELVRVAAQEVFTTMLGMELIASPVQVAQEPPTVTDGVLALIGLAGPWTGAGTITCSATFACRICAQFLMTEAASVNEEVLDAMGEVTNMIIGNFKTMAEETLGPLGLSIPTVIFGRNFTSRSIGRNEWIVQPFTCEGEAFEVRVCLFPSKDQSAPAHGFSQPSAVVM